MMITSLKSGRKFVTADPVKCTGCGTCELVCSFEKNQVFNPLKSNIRIVRSPPSIYLAVTCRLCEDPKCVHACPRNALNQDEVTGIIFVDEDKCDGCGWCLEACNFGSMIFNPETRTVMACDLCIDREEGPICIEWCKYEALSMESKETLTMKSRLKAVRDLMYEEEKI